MRKLIYLSFLLTLLSCSQSIVSSRPSIVISIEKNGEDINKEKYIVVARYIGDPVQVSSLCDGRIKTNVFLLYTDKKYSIGDTIRLGQ